MHWVCLVFVISSCFHVSQEKPRTLSKKDGDIDSLLETHAPYEPVDWDERGREELQETLNVIQKWLPAKNVIIFVGDGMGISTLTASRMHKAQRAGLSVTEGKLSWENMPYTGLVKVYTADHQIPDSASTATAFLAGEKTRDGVIGVNQHVPRGNCTAMAGNQLKSIIHHGIDKGKWTGIVTTSALTAATSSAAYGHSPERNWKVDTDVPEVDRDTCWDLARQMIHNEINKNMRVLQAGGRSYFTPTNMTDPEYTDVQGLRGDGRDLLQEWIDIHMDMGFTEEEVVLARNMAEFNSTDPSKVQYFLGCYEPEDMKPEADRLDEDPSDAWSEPSLTQMVDKAIDILARGPQGYILLAESDRIDNAHHETNAHRALVDTLSLDEAVQLAMDKTNSNDTLILLTADHSHTMVISGGHRLETHVLGVVTDNNGELIPAEDGKPYLILDYSNGPGHEYHRMDGDVEVPRLDLTNITTTGRDFLQDAGINMLSETHTAEDVPVYARGPMSHLFTGQHEQNYLAHAMMYAACVGPNTENCDDPKGPEPCPTTSGYRVVTSGNVFILILGVVRCYILLLF